MWDALAKGMIYGAGYFTSAVFVMGATRMIDRFFDLPSAVAVSIGMASCMAAGALWCVLGSASKKTGG